MKFDRIIPQVNTHRLTEVAILLRCGTFKMAPGTSAAAYEQRPPGAR